METQTEINISSKISMIFTTFATFDHFTQYLPVEESPKVQI